MVRARVLPVLLILLVAGAQAQAPSSDPDVVRARLVQLRPNVTLGGTVVPFKLVTLAAQLPGRVSYIAGEEGDTFEEGTLLVALDEDELLAQRRAAFAALRDADAQLRGAGVMYSRELWSPQSAPANRAPGGMGIPSMFDQFFTSPMQSMMGQNRPYVDRYADIYSSGVRIEQARNAYLRAQSQLQQLDAKLRDAKSIAPFDGMIIRKLAEAGDTVQPGQPMLEFAEAEVLQIEVHVPARLMHRGIREGDIVDARLDVGNRRLTVRVAQIFPMADPQRHTVKVKLDLPPNSPAAPGMYAEIMVPDPTAPARNMLIVPAGAIIRRGSLPMVEVMTENNGRSLRVVRLGEYLDRNTVSILSGLRPGELVHIQRRGPEPG